LTWRDRLCRPWRTLALPYLGKTVCYQNQKSLLGAMFASRAFKLKTFNRFATKAQSRKFSENIIVKDYRGLDTPPSKPNNPTPPNQETPDFRIDTSSLKKSSMQHKLIQ
jgi:hypothetical protein